MFKLKNKIIFDLSPKIAYLSGVIIGDGHLSNSTKSKTDLSPDYRIIIDISDKKFLVYIVKLIKSLIKTKSSIKESVIRGNRKPRSYFQLRNKYFYNFLTNELKIPKGNKSTSVSIPNQILNSSEQIKKCFIAGYFDADGGFRSGTLGFTSASIKLMSQLSLLLNEFYIKHSDEKWIHKKYNKSFYGIRIKRGQIDKFLNSFPFQNKEKLVRIYERFYEGVPERPNGTDSNEVQA